MVKVLTIKVILKLYLCLAHLKIFKFHCHKDGNVTTDHVTGELIVFTTAEIVPGQKSSSQ